MPIEYNLISKVVSVDVTLFESRDNPLMTIEVVSRGRNRHLQLYIQPTKPYQVQNILIELEKRKFIKRPQFKKLACETRKLEHILLSNPAYAAINDAQ